MLQTPWLFLLIVVAIACGWLLGRRSLWGQHKSEHGSSLSQQYYKGLNYLLNDQPDGALDSFIKALEVNSETLETHLAVGNLMRRKGEVERAIRIHQNLLARPSLEKEYLHQAHLELACDYISAGLLDRAEGLLLDLAQEAPELQAIARKYLLEIYQDEREWRSAIEVAKCLLPRKGLLKSPVGDVAVATALAHYYCELAEEQLALRNIRDARNLLKDALSQDRDCVRASLLLGQLEMQTQHYQEAIKAYRKVVGQNPHFIPEILAPLKSCYEALNKPDSYRQFLQECVEQFPSSHSILALARWIKDQEGDEAATALVSKELQRRPSLKGLSELVNLHLSGSEGRAKENLSILQLLIEQLIKDRPSYQCKHCGFTGKKLHWLCPSCKQWGQVEYIRSAEGD
jgi:lipopolysaccharide biosynthesis regulator YciM